MLRGVKGVVVKRITCSFIISSQVFISRRWSSDWWNKGQSLVQHVREIEVGVSLPLRELGNAPLLDLVSQSTFEPLPLKSELSPDELDGFLEQDGIDPRSPSSPSSKRLRVDWRRGSTAAVGNGDSPETWVLCFRRRRLQAPVVTIINSCMGSCARRAEERLRQSALSVGRLDEAMSSRENRVSKLHDLLVLLDLIGLFVRKTNW
ncbi:hypothetical protein TOPH_02336 [Tolypocladium ophioglossoides CBS 100239]|uniref:Uncharacterized protein n=1 Tax=Tolypocladium ophioglossoides (strain CBS 100239) TaxID=1163406 RepID=A0A0L0NH15_TOLOC|nr:hypothetical protein TOPH_02336 [Tolypocladium ophioglossoides CBS 100239]